MPFPLLRLPLLASINIIKSIDVEDIINVIHLSTKTRKLVKISKIRIQLFVVGGSKFYFNKLSDPIGFKTLFLNSKESTKHLPFQSSVSLYTHDKEVKGYRRMMDDFAKFFVVESVELNLSTIVSSEICLKYLEYVMNLGLNLTQVLLTTNDQRGVEPNVDDTRKLLSACAHVPQLEIFSFTQNPIYDVFHEYSMDRFKLVIPHSHGKFTIDHLLSLINCSSVEIEDVTLSDEDFNTFLKFWMTGAGRMRSLNIELAYNEMNIEEPFDVDVVMDGIARRELRRNKTFEIEKSDGVKAKIWFRNFQFKLRSVD